MFFIYVKMGGGWMRWRGGEGWKMKSVCMALRVAYKTSPRTGWSWSVRQVNPKLVLFLRKAGCFPENERTVGKYSGDFCSLTRLYKILGWGRSLASSCAYAVDVFFFFFQKHLKWAQLFSCSIFYTWHFTLWVGVIRIMTTSLLRKVRKELLPFGINMFPLKSVWNTS